MDIYMQKSRWKWYLGIAAVVIVLLSMGFTTYLTNQLAAEERKKVEIHLSALKYYTSGLEETDGSQCDYTIIQEILSANTTIPILLVDDQEEIVAAANFGTQRDTNTVFLERELKRMKSNGDNFIKVESFNQRAYYKQSTILTALQYFPFVQLLLIMAFVSFGYFAFSSARRSEQNRVWAGLAKETAHQLGTPITAIVGWIDHLKLMKEGDEEVEEIAEELRNDVTRLELIADRFSKIGSAPELKASNVFDELEDCRTYMQRRASRRVKFEFPDLSQVEPIEVQINSHLFAWVIENLLRNALDAMSGTGTIAAKVIEEPNFVSIEVSDTGKGIPTAKWKSVFRPGYTTKKRGWGLGLSLAKRIIEDYHRGKIFVKHSKEGVGTTFCVKLPKS